MPPTVTTLIFILPNQFFRGVPDSFQVYAVVMLTFNLISVLLTTMSTLHHFRVERVEEGQTSEADVVSAVPSENERLRNLTSSYSQVMILMFNTRFHPVLEILEVIIVAVISLDLLVRFAICPNKRRFFLSVMNAIALIGLIPVWLAVAMYIPILALPDSAFTWEYTYTFHIVWLLRSLRVFYLFHIVTYYRSFKVMILALRESYKELLLLVVLLAIGATLFGSIVFLADIQEDIFWTVPDGIWWAFITMTTVGYGDKAPVSVYGRVVGIFCAMTGLIVIAMPVPIIANNFGKFYDLASLQKIQGRKEEDREDTESVNSYTNNISVVSLR